MEHSSLQHSLTPFLPYEYFMCVCFNHTNLTSPAQPVPDDKQRMTTRLQKKSLNAGVAEKARSRRADGGIRWLRDGGDRKKRRGRKEKSAEIALSA